MGPIKGYSVCPFRRGYNLFRVDAVVRASEMTGHNGRTHTSAVFDFVECIPTLLDRRLFSADVSQSLD